MRKGYIYSIRCGVDKFALGTKQYSTPVMAFCKLCFDGFLYVCSRMFVWLMIVKQLPFNSTMYCIVLVFYLLLCRERERLWPKHIDEL